MTVGATGYIHWIPDTPGGVPRMTAGGELIQFLIGDKWLVIPIILCCNRP